MGAGKVGKKSCGLSVTQIVIDRDILYNMQHLPTRLCCIIRYCVKCFDVYYISYMY